MITGPWTVTMVPTYPNQWKVIPQHTYKETNDLTNFFPDRAQALREAEKRNKQHQRNLRNK